MALNINKPADTEYLADAPALIRENDRALQQDQVVDAGKLKGYVPGNASDNIPLNNNTLNVGLNAEKLGGQPGSYYAPSSHVHNVATTSSDGFMASTDKQKLDSVATGAEVNQNAFSNVLVGSTTIQADGKTDTLTLTAGAGITLTPDAANDAVTIAITQDGHSHATATTGTPGFIAVGDKQKLDGIAVGAEVNQNAFSTIVAGGVSAVADQKSDTFTINSGSGITITGDAANDACTIAITPDGHSHEDATTGAAGFMTAAMVTKLNGIATGAQTNQNAFSNVLVGTTTLAADSVTDTLEIVAGTNVSITADAANDRLTINNTYAHPTGDGNLHVPATGTTNNTKVLKAGPTAGSAAWGQVAAGEVAFTPINGITSTNVQGAIADLVQGPIAELKTSKLETSEVVATAAANKVLKLNASGVLPTSITGNADTVDNKHATDFHQVYLGVCSNFDTALTQGDYLVSSASTLAGAPYSGAIYGKLVVLVQDGATFTTAKTMWQIFYPSTSGAFPYYRNLVSTGVWSAWKQYLSSDATFGTASNITVTGSTETNITNAGGYLYSGNLYALNRVIGIAAGTYTLQNLLQALVTKSHSHTSTTLSGINCVCCNGCG